MDHRIIIRRIGLFSIWIFVMFLVWKRFDVSHYATEDAQPPVLHSIQELSPETVVYRNGSLAIQAVIEDNIGVQGYGITVRKEGETEVTLIYPVNQTTTLYQMMIAIPSNFPAGNYEICKIDLVDVNQNTASYVKEMDGWYLNGERQEELSGSLAFEVLENRVDEPESESELESEAEKESESELESESEKESESEPESESEKESESKLESESEKESESEPESESEKESESEPESESEKESESESESESEKESESEPESESETPEVKQGLLSITQPVGETSITLPSTYTIQMSGKDDRGFKNIEIILANQSESGASGRFSVDLENITSFHSVSFCIPEGSMQPGIYHVSEIILINSEGDKGYYYRKEKIQDGVRTYGNQWYSNAAAVEGMEANLKLKILGTETDTEGPKISEISGIEYIKSDTDMDKVKLLMKASDQSGIVSAMINFRKAGEALADRASYVEMDVSRNITSLSMNIYEGMLENGMYVIDKIVMGDIHGNASVYTCEDGVWYCNDQAVSEKQMILRFTYENDKAENGKEENTTTNRLQNSTQAATNYTVQNTTQKSTQNDSSKQNTGSAGTQPENNTALVYITPTSSKKTTKTTASQQNEENASSEEATTLPEETSTEGDSVQPQIIEEEKIQEAFSNLTVDGEAVIDISEVHNVPSLAFGLLEEMGDGALILKADDYIWRFQRQYLTNVNAVSGFFNAEIVLGDAVSNAKMDEFIEEYHIDTDMLKYQIKYGSQFPGKADVGIKWSTDYSGMKAYVYMMNNDVPVLYTETEVDKEGFLSFCTENGMTGFITVKEVVMPISEEEEMLQKAIKESEKLSNNKMLQGVMIIAGAFAAAVILCVIVVVSKRRKPADGKGESSDGE